MGLQWTTRRTIHQLVKEGKPFLLGNIRAERFELPEMPSTGRLPQNWAVQLSDDILAHNTVYVVYSYETPIAWQTTTDWIIPDVTYSKTTTHHQSVIRVAIGTNCYQ